MIFFTADEHYYHNNIIGKESYSGRREGRRFKTVAEMNETIIKKHNEIVTKDDTTYHLGDFSFAKSWQDTRHILEKLNGTHILIFGNHDLFRHWEYLEMGFQSVHSSLELIQGWKAWVNATTGIKYPILIHDPAAAGVYKDKYFVHGHTHGLGLKLADNTFCVSVELHDYYPVPITNLSFGR